MEILKNVINLKECEKKIKIAFIGDLHIGHALFDENAWNKAVKYLEKEIEKNKHYYIVFMGDIIDAITIYDKRFDPLEVSEKFAIRDLKDLPRKQANYFLNTIKNIPHERILCALIGNHEEVYVKKNQFDVYDYYCAKKNIKKMGYLGYLCLSIISRENEDRWKTTNRLSLFLSHGTGKGGINETYSLLKVIQTGRWIDADIILQGHLHNLDSKVIEREYVTRAGYKLAYKPMLFGNTGTFLQKRSIGKKGYFEANASSRTPIGFLEIDFKIVKTKFNANKINFTEIKKYF